MSPSVIRVLPENLANKIAAGEVVERPASIIKELVENSIDAGATCIAIDLAGGGKRSIHIQDDGVGMNKDDALLAFERHATSKIRSDEDLFKIHTLGFRGEALPSIAAVSKICMTTAQGDSPSGMRLFLDGGVVREVKEAPHPKGTSLKVEQLFFNTPARRKFLKTEETELGHVSQCAMRQALARPDISFRLLHNGKKLLDSPSRPGILPRIMDFFGRDVAAGLIPIQAARDGMALEGYSRAGKEAMCVYVNRRFVRDKLISAAIMEAYRTLLPRGRNPMLFLFLETDPSDVDVNVHPSKTEVRFTRPNEIHGFILESLRRGLHPGNGKVRTSFPSPAPEAATEVREPLPVSGFATKADFKAFSPPVSFPRFSEPFKTVSIKKTEKDGAPLFSSFPAEKSVLVDASAIGYADFRPLGQMDKTYLVLEGKEGLILVDQHTAHERILYERFLAAREKRSMETQRLLFPMTMELARGELLLLEPLFPHLESLGFELESFGGDSLAVRSVPALLSGKDCRTLLRDLFDKASSRGTGTSFEEMAGDLIAVMACHAAVRSGEELKPEEIRSLMEELKATNRPYTCPHGRPIALFFGMDQIKKSFLRSL